MKKLTLPLLIAFLSISALAQTKTAARPRITGIDHVAFYTTDADGVKNLYVTELGLAEADPTEPGETIRYTVGKKWVGYSPAPDPKASDRMDHVAFTTDNIAALRRYLVEKGSKPSQIQGHSDHTLSFTVDDPEGHRIRIRRAQQSGSARAAGFRRVAPHDPHRLSGAEPRGRRSLLSRCSGLPSLLAWRHERERDRLGVGSGS